MNSYAGAVLNQLDRLFNRGTIAGLSEGTLLERYVADGDEAAFAALVARHGPMVLGVCRRVLRDERDVEDAFQATFLVLVRRAGAVRDGELVGRWLHGVAHRVAVRARAHSARRFAHEQATDEPVEPEAGDSPVEAIERRELASIVDEELTRLPSSLRAPVALCYLEGLSHDEAARRLRWSVGTVRSRMARAREILRHRLARRGVTADGMAIVASLANSPVPPEWIDATVRGSLNFAKHSATAAAIASARSAAIARRVLLTMAITKLTYIGAAGLGIALALGRIPTLAVQDDARPGRSAPERIRNDVGREKSPKDSPANLARFDKQAPMKWELAQKESKLPRKYEEMRILKEKLAALTKPLPAGSSTPAPVQTDGRSEDPTAGSSKPPASAEPGDRSRGSEHAQFVYLDQASNGQMHKLVVVSPDGAKVALYDSQSGKSVQLKLPAIKGVRRDVSFRPWKWKPDFLASSPLPDRVISTNDPWFSALDLDQGGRVTQVVAFNVLDGTSSVADVPEPADRASVKIFLNGAVFRVGRHLYAYSKQAKRWGELKVASGAEAEPYDVSGALMVQANEKLYRFDYGAGKWDDIYASSIGDEPAGSSK